MSYQDLADQISQAPAAGLAQRRSVPNVSGIYAVWLDDKTELLSLGRTAKLRRAIDALYTKPRQSSMMALRLYDKYVHPLRPPQASTEDVNALTRRWIAEHIHFTYVEVPWPDTQQALRELLHALQPAVHAGRL